MDSSKWRRNLWYTPLEIYGEGLSTIKSNQKKGQFAGLTDTRNYNETDIRFTTKGNTVYAFCLEKPTKNIRMISFGTNSTIGGKEIKSVKMLGSDIKLHWKQKGDALVINMPAKLPVEQVPVITFRIEFK